MVARLAQAMAQLGGDPIAKLERYRNDAERSFKAKRELENARKSAAKTKNETKPIQTEPESELGSNPEDTDDSEDTDAFDPEIGRASCRERV